LWSWLWEDFQCWSLQPNQTRPPVFCLLHPIPTFPTMPTTHSQQMMPLIRALPTSEEYDLGKSFCTFLISCWMGMQVKIFCFFPPESGSHKWGSVHKLKCVTCVYIESTYGCTRCAKYNETHKSKEIISS
jgi:hypothetical protein